MSEIDSSVISSGPRNTGEMLERALRRAQAHVERVLLAARTLRAGTGRPAPRLDLRDRMAVRALVLILVITTFIAA